VSLERALGALKDERAPGNIHYGRATLARAGTLPEETDSLTLEPGEIVTPTGDDAHPAAVGRGAGSDWRPDLGTFCRRTLR
jgi:hypothetical protein